MSTLYVARFDKLGTDTIFTTRIPVDARELLRTLVRDGKAPPGQYIVCRPDDQRLRGRTYTISDHEIHRGLIEAPTNVTHWPPR